MDEVGWGSIMIQAVQFEENEQTLLQLLLVYNCATAAKAR